MLSGLQPSVSTPAARSAPSLHTRVAAAREAIDRRIAAALSIAIAGGILMALAVPAQALAWDANSFNSASESQLYSLTNQSRAAGGMPSLRIDSTLASHRAVAEPGHGGSRLLQPQHPAIRKDGVGPDGRTRLLLQPRGREHRLEQLPRRRGDRADPAHVHGLARTPRKHHGPRLGRRGHRRVQGLRRPHDVDGPVRRQGGLRITGRRNAEADAQAHPEAHAEANAQAHAEADPAPDPEADTHGHADTHCHADANADTHAAAHPDSDPDAGAGAHADSNAATHAEADAATDADARTGRRDATADSSTDAPSDPAPDATTYAPSDPEARTRHDRDATDRPRD